MPVERMTESVLCFEETVSEAEMATQPPGEMAERHRDLAKEIRHSWKENVQQRHEMQKLRAAAQAMVSKLHAIVQDADYTAMALLYANHGFRYTGLTWVHELSMLKAALEPER